MPDPNAPLDGPAAGASGRVALLAHPAGHSVSPVMQRAAFAARGIRATYDALDVAPGDLAEAVAALRRGPWWGANVTVPHKTAVVPWMDELTPAAQRLGAVNTIVRRGERLIGDNSDLPGFMRALAALGVDLAGSSVVVIGAGGAARAVVAGLADAGARIALRNRGTDRARALVDSLELPDVTLLAAAALEDAVVGCELLVQTTTVGMAGGPPGSPLPDGLLPHHGAVVDLVYRPAVTPLLAAASAAGLRAQNGLPMLVYQGALSFEAWTGVAAPVEAMGAAAEAALGGPGRGWSGPLADDDRPRVG
ncbi:MAG: shikimate dehydrogenase [Trueperaceae bacterium]